MISSQSSSRGLAIVTGAAGGLGSAFARKLAARGHRLLLIDRRAEPLESLSKSISDQYGVPVEPYTADFSDRDQVEQMSKWFSQLNDVDLLVNNAGFGTLDHFVDTDPRLIMSMVDVHVMTPMLLTHAVLPRMLQRDCGAIINVSSISAWFQSAGNSHYGSTKICLAAFTMSLSEELRGTRIRVQALCPGFVRTQFHQAESMRSFQRLLPSSRMWAQADDVVEFSLRRLSSHQVVAIPGYGYRVIGRLARMPLLQPLMRRITRVPRAACASTASKPTAITAGQAPQPSALTAVPTVTARPQSLA